MVTHVLIVHYVCDLLPQSLVNLNPLFAHSIFKLLARDEFRGAAIAINDKEARILEVFGVWVLVLANLF